MRAALCEEYNQPLRVEEVDVQPPGSGEVLVKIAASGVCASDLHAVEGHSGIVRLPLIPGHEGAGTLEEIGADVTGLEVGDHVVIALYGPCGTCGSCRSGDIARCAGETRRNNMFGLMPDGSTRLRRGDQTVHPMVGSGSLAEYAVVRQAQVVKIDPDIPLDCACLAGCGVTTGIGAVLNTARVEPGSSVVVIGCGGVGLNVVQGARIAGAASILAVDTRPQKLELAARLGSTDGLLAAKDTNLSKAIRAKIRGGADYAFEVVGHPDLVRQAFASTRPAGTTVMVGAPPLKADIAVDGQMLFQDRRLLGCTGGLNVPQRDISRIMALYKQGVLKLDELISQRLPLSEVNQAFDALRKGDLARTVILPGSGD